MTGFDAIAADYIGGWQRWHRARGRRGAPGADENPLIDFSAAMMRVHESKSFPRRRHRQSFGAVGFNKGDERPGWIPPRLAQRHRRTAGGFLAVDALRRCASRVAVSAGHAGCRWPLCQKCGSTDRVLERDAVGRNGPAGIARRFAARTGALNPGERQRYGPMIRRAAGFIVRNGPVTPQDRWEEDPGYSPFTLAAEIAALLVAADDADSNGECEVGRYLRETADTWHSCLDDWMYVTDTDLARRCGVQGYYIRIAARDDTDAASPAKRFVPIRNRPASDSTASAALTVSPDALALVRFGLRAADDPRITNTVKGATWCESRTPNGPE